MVKQQLIQSVNESIDAVSQLKEPHALIFIEEVATLLAHTYRMGNKVLIAGNGGSLCDAMHFAEELTGFFRTKRPALPAIALSDPGHITCTANDASFEEIFSRGIEAHGKPGDVFIALTTSGNSANLVRAIQVANENGLKTVSLLGKGGGKLKDIAHHELIIHHHKTSDRIQEAHMAALHIIIELVELQLFPQKEISMRAST